MGLIEQEMMDLNQLFKLWMGKKLTKEELAGGMAIMSQSEKRAKMKLHYQTLEIKFSGKDPSIISKSNLMSSDQVLDLVHDYELDKVLCPTMSKIITRHDCLDYSGEADHHAVCKKCDSFSMTRRLLLPNDKPNNKLVGDE